MLLDNCSWDNPGAHVYTGTSESAIMRMTTIPEPVRKQLIEKVRKNQFDEVVVISKDSIVGKDKYDPSLTYMASGSKGNVCRNVTRQNWKSYWKYEALVYSVSGYVIARPNICNNWSILQRQTDKVVSEAPTSGGGGVGFVFVETELPAQVFHLPPAEPTSEIVSPVVIFVPMELPSGYIPFSVPLPAVSEPGTLVLSCLGIGLFWSVRRMKWNIKSADLTKKIILPLSTKVKASLSPE